MEIMQEEKIFCKAQSAISSEKSKKTLCPKNKNRMQKKKHTKRLKNRNNIQKTKSTLEIKKHSSRN